MARSSRKAQAASAAAEPEKSGGTTAAAKKTAAKATSAKKASSGSASKKASSSSSSKKASSSASGAAKAGTGTKKAAKKSAGTKKSAAKKASPARARKAPVSALAVKAGEDAWTKAELDEVLAELHEHRDRIRALFDAHEAELAGLMRDSGDGAGHDQADLGATSFERDQELSVLNNEREMLAQIERALDRIHDGSYGSCESCGEPIGKGRLMVFPRATLCLSCKQREERR